jgi:hypothetical protein
MLRFATRFVFVVTLATYLFASAPWASAGSKRNTLTSQPTVGDIFVCEDMGVIGFPDDPEICVLEPNGVVSVFVRAVGHRLSELTGPAFSPAGDRLYFSSQRGTDGRGITFEVSGPFPT